MFASLHPDDTLWQSNPVQGNAFVATGLEQLAWYAYLHALQPAMDDCLAFVQKCIMGNRQVEFVKVVAILVLFDSQDCAARCIPAAGHTHTEQFVFCFELVQGGNNQATAGDDFLATVLRFPLRCLCQYGIGPIRRRQMPAPVL